MAARRSILALERMEISSTKPIFPQAADAGSKRGTTGTPAFSMPLVPREWPGFPNRVDPYHRKRREDNRYMGAIRCDTGLLSER